MTFITVLLLVLAGVATLFLMPAVGAVQRLNSTHAAGSEITFLFLCAPRWLAISAVLCVLIARGSFAWIAEGTGVQAAAVFGTHMVSGLVCGACLVVVREQLPIVRLGLWIFAVAVPVLVIAYATVAVVSDEMPAPWLRWTIATVPILAAVGVVAVVRVKARFDDESLHPGKRRARLAANRTRIPTHS